MTEYLVLQLLKDMNIDKAAGIDSFQENFKQMGQKYPSKTNL